MKNGDFPINHGDVRCPMALGPKMIPYEPTYKPYF